MNNQPLVIEFIGLPGAGKTTTAQIAISTLCADGYRCFGLSTLDSPENLEKEKGGFSSKLRMLNLFVSSCVSFTQIALNAFIFVINVRPISIVNLRRFVLFMVRINSIKTLMSDNYDFIILDQGLFQSIWSIMVTGDQPDEGKYLERVLNSILDEITLFIIMIDVETELALNRIISRPTMRSRFDRMSPPEAEAILSEYKELFSQLVDSAGTYRNTGYLNVNGSQPVKENVDLIVPIILQARQGISL